MGAYLEMSVKVFSAHIYMVRAYFAAVLDAQSVQLVQPIRNWFAVPAEGKFERIVDTLFLLFLFGWTVPSRIGRRRRRLCLV
jgi:hypothetical protein